jgi:hypothetical protein
MDMVDVLRAAASSIGGGLGVAVAVDLLLIAPTRDGRPVLQAHKQSAIDLWVCSDRSRVFSETRR